MTTIFISKYTFVLVRNCTVFITIYGKHDLRVYLALFIFITQVIIYMKKSLPINSLPWKSKKRVRESIVICLTKAKEKVV